MPSLRLKTKLVIAITLMVVVIVASLSALYIYEVISQRIEELDKDSRSTALQVVAVATSSLKVDLRDARIDLNDPKQVNAILIDLLESDSAVNSLLEYWISEQDAILDIAITDTSGRVISHSDQSMLGKTLPQREDLGDFVHARIRDKLRIIYGPGRVYERRVGLQNMDGAPFGEVRLGVSTTFLRNEIKPSVDRAIAVFTECDLYVTDRFRRGLHNCTTPADADQQTIGRFDVRPGAAGRKRVWPVRRIWGCIAQD